MKFSRRKLVHLTAGAAALPFLPRGAFADTYPSRPGRIVVAFAPGGGQDLLGRLVGEWLSQRLGQQFIVENRPGGASNNATDAVARAAPDGYTLLLVGPQNAINVGLYTNLTYTFLKDIEPIGSISREASDLVVNPSFAPKTVLELIAYAKANPGKVVMASAGVGSAGHVAGELFMMMTGTKLLHVPYRGLAPALVDLMGGRADLCFSNLPGSIELVRSAKLRALAVTTAGRSEALPDVPALAEAVPGYEASALFGLGAPKNTPSDIVDKINKELNAALADPSVKAKFLGWGASVLTSSPAEFGKLMADETAKWAKVIQFAGIKPS